MLDTLEYKMNNSIIKDSLICQILKDGSIYGNDHDGRLGPITTTINKNKHNIADETVLDLGSNAGHFPIEYIRAGAKKVIAVEGRYKFKQQWNRIKSKIFGIDTNKIEWNVADVKNISIRSHTLISCLGLVYHMDNAWSTLKRLLTPSVKMMIIESQLWESCSMGKESACDNTRVLKDGLVERLTLPAMEKKLSNNFADNFSIRRVMVSYRGVLTDDYKSGDWNMPMNGPIRGLWVLIKKEKGETSDILR